VKTLVADQGLPTGPTRRAKQNVFDRQFQVLVGRDADRVLNAACLQRLVHLAPGKGGVGAERDALALLLAVDLQKEQLVQLSALVMLPDRSLAARQSP
jgi:hypothetical protein